MISQTARLGPYAAYCTKCMRDFRNSKTKINAEFRIIQFSFRQKLKCLEKNGKIETAHGPRPYLASPPSKTHKEIEMAHGQRTAMSQVPWKLKTQARSCSYPGYQVSYWISRFGTTAQASSTYYQVQFFLSNGFELVVWGGFCRYFWTGSEVSVNTAALVLGMIIKKCAE